MRKKSASNNTAPSSTQGRRGVLSLGRKRLPFFSVCFFLLLTACGSVSKPQNVSFYGLEKTRPDPLAARHIVLVYLHTGERLDTVYYRNGHYDARELRKINILFRDHRANVVGKIDPELIDYLVDIRTRLDLPETVPFEILSGYRTPATNARLAKTNGNVAKESLHMHGWAVDFRIPYVNGKLIGAIAETMQRGGFAYYPADNHVHLDLGNIRTWKSGG